MSALGQKQTLQAVSCDVRFTPKSGHSLRPARRKSIRIFYDPDVAAVVINELNCFLERNFVYTPQCGSIYHAVNRLPEGPLCPYRFSCQHS